MPKPRGKDNFIGVEIECYSKHDRYSLSKLLRKDIKIRNKFDVVGDSSIYPTSLLKKGWKRLKTKSKYVKREVGKSIYNYLNRWERSYTNKKYYKTKLIDLYYYEEVYNGKKWIKNKVKYYPDKEYLNFRSNWNEYDYTFYFLDGTYEVDEDGEVAVSNILHGTEIRLLCKQKEMNIVLSRVFKILNANSVMVNKSCGLHVHLDMRNRNKELAYKNLYKCQNLLLKIQPSRKGSQWCKKNTKTTYDKQQSLYGRYYVINTDSYRIHKTLEIRIGTATMDIKKIISWIRLLTNIVDMKTELNKEVKSIKDYLSVFNFCKRNVNALKVMQKKGA